jgi:hypothetical protein
VDLLRRGHAGQGADGGVHLLLECPRLDAELLQHGRDDAALLPDQRRKQMLGLQQGVLSLLGEPLGGDDGFLSLLGQLVRVECHGDPPGARGEWHEVGGSGSRMLPA